MIVDATRRGTRPLAGLALATVLALSATSGCSTSGGGKLVHTDDGFRITEAGSLPLGERSRFREATAALKADDLDKAIEGLEAAAEASPDHAAPRINLAIALRRTDRLEEAEQVLREAIAIHPRHIVAHNELGLVYRRLGRLDEARSSYERAIALHGDFHVAHRNLGVLCDLFLGDSGCALTHYRKTLEIVPDDADVAMWVQDLEQRRAQ